MNNPEPDQNEALTSLQKDAVNQALQRNSQELKKLIHILDATGERERADEAFEILIAKENELAQKADRDPDVKAS